MLPSPQEAGSRTASLKRSNQVRGLRHSRSVSCETLQHLWAAIAISWHGLLFYFFLFILPRSKATTTKKKHHLFPHPWNESSSRHLHHADTFSGVSILNLSPETSAWRPCSVKAAVLNVDMDACSPCVNIPSRSSQVAAFPALYQPTEL